MYNELTKFLNSLLKGDKHVTENKVFTLHHRINFFVIMIGVACLFAGNYLVKDPITCLGGGDYAKAYCWLHGARQLPDHLSQAVSYCVGEQKEGNKPLSSYYIWLPYVLLICAVIVKAPRFIWKTIGERGMIESVVELRKDEKMKATPEKMAGRFKKIQGSNRSRHFCLSFLFCEILNFLSVILLFIILDSLLDGEFWGYGAKVIKYWQSEEKGASPMCTAFPTEVSCDVSIGGASGGIDNKNTICILSNNMFNQYYFLILWVWWCFLLVISGFYILYDLMKFTVPAFTATRLKYSLMLYEKEKSLVDNLDMSKYDMYLLARINQNLKGSEIESLLRELQPQLENHKERNEMILNMVERD